PLGDSAAVARDPAPELSRQTHIALIGGRGLDGHFTGASTRLHLLRGLRHEQPGILLLLPAARVADRRVALDAFDFERGADDDRRSVRRDHEQDEPFAAPGVVTGEILKIRTRLDHEEIELASLELVLGSLDSLREACGTQAGPL